MIGFVVGRLAVGLVVGAVLALGASAAGTALGETLTDGPVPARELCRGAVCVPEADALRATIARERVKSARLIASLRRENRGLHRALHASPTTRDAITIGSVVSGTPRNVLDAVAWCESRHDPNAENATSTAAGLMQYIDTTWADTTMGRAGISRLNPYAAAIQAGYSIRHRGLGPWTESRGCWGPRIGR